MANNDKRILGLITAFSQGKKIGEYYTTPCGMVLMLIAEEHTEEEYKRLANVMIEDYFRRAKNE